MPLARLGAWCFIVERFTPHYRRIAPLKTLHHAISLILAVLFAAVFAGGPPARAQVIVDGFYQIEKVCQGVTFCQILNPIDVDGRVFFVVNQVDPKQALWVSDGTEEGTYLVRSFAPTEYYPYYSLDLRGQGSAIAFGSDLLFFAPDGLGMKGLWRADGTGDGTELLIPGIHHGKLIAFKNEAYVLVQDSQNAPIKIWKTDGTASGTRMAQEFGGSIPFTAQNDTEMYLLVSMSDKSGELWKTSGEQFTKINTFSYLEEPKNPVFFNNMLYFSDQNAVWKSNEPPAANLAFFVDSGSIREMTIANNLFFFNANISIEYLGIPDQPIDVVWQSNDTQAGTKSITNTAEGRNPQFFTPFKNELYFIGSPSKFTTTTLYKTKGQITTGNSLMEVDSMQLFDLDAGEYLKIINNRLYYISTGPYGAYWKYTDGTSIHSLWTSGHNYGYPGDLTLFKGSLYFSARDSHWVDFNRVEYTNNELWVSENGNTHRALDLYGAESSNPGQLTVSGEHMFFTTQAAENLYELWVYGPIVLDQAVYLPAVIR